MKVNVFAPTYHRLEMTKRCLETLIPQVNSSQHDVTLFVCDNDSHVEMKEWLKSLASDKVRVLLCDSNMGKAGIVNKIYKDFGSDCTHVISIDSDFIVDEEYNFIDEMVWCIENFDGYGMLSTFQKENNQHIWDQLPNVEKKENHEVAFGNFRGIAGGCVILKKEFWDKIGGYKTFGNVYGFDDGLLAQDVYFNGKKSGVIKTVKMTHPHDDDNGYVDWKKKNIATRQVKGYYETK
jgi:GT2 family glycosyltransferase